MVLTGKVAIVTGGASGIGSEICRRFAREGARVAVADINCTGAQAMADEIQRQGGTAVPVAVDIRDYKAVEAAAETVLTAHGSIDILLNCAGLNSFVAPEEITTEIWERLRSVNLDGSWNFCRAAVPAMMRQRSGKIVNIGSAAAVQAIPKALPYVVAKHGVVGLTRALAVDLGPYGINVNCICPGPIQTPLLDSATSENFRESIRKTIPLDRLGKPSDVAHAAVFLASAASDFITGVTLPVDGGLVCCVRAHHFE